MARGIFVPEYLSYPRETDEYRRSLIISSLVIVDRGHVTLKQRVIINH